MEFESPDVEREFPGLYASESARRSNESDFSDEAHEKLSKKDLLIGKRKDKKDKKDRGYATLEGESSCEEDVEMKSPSKTKKSKPFKFPLKKEKREKSREKDTKEKESDKEKKKCDDKEREKKKESKSKLKIKEKKKTKHVEEPNDVHDFPVFGVPLSVAIERSKCHDGIDIPLVLRHCIDHIEATGLLAENLYKVSGIKSRVQQVRRMYNNQEPVCMRDYDLPVATSLLKQFLKELPEPVLTTELIEKFEESAACNLVSERGERFKALIIELPSCNRTLLGWLLKHFDHVTVHEKVNKMNAQAIATTISPYMQTSQRLLSALLCHVSELFPNLTLIKYVPPVTSLTPGLPENSEGLSQELAKQESLLMQLHREMNQGLGGKVREEQLWGVQRIITQLNRKIRSLERTNGCQRSLDETDTPVKSELAIPVVEKVASEPTTPQQPGNCEKVSIPDTQKIESPIPLPRKAPIVIQDEPVMVIPHRPVPTAESLEVQDINRESTEKAMKMEKSVIETEVLMNTINKLKADYMAEREELKLIKQQIHALGGLPEVWGFLSDSSDDEIVPALDQDGLWKRRIELKQETKRLQKHKKLLTDSLIAECDSCIDLKIQIRLLQISMGN